jgi:hypothetical protein
MTHLHLLSDHVYDWSARSLEQNIISVAQAQASVAAEASAVGCGAARLADRALQTLRQTGLQVRRGSRPWPKVLPISELSRRATADGLRAPGKSGSHPRARRQLPRGTCGARRSVRDQSRAFTAPRGALRLGGERNVAAAHPTDRRFRRCAAPRQHGRGMARRRAALNHHRGDHR